MRGLIAAIRRALAALANGTWKLVRIGGRLIRMLVPSPLPPSPEQIVENALGERPQIDATLDERLQSIRELAHAMISGAARGEHFGAVHENDARWLMAMPPEMLRVVVCTTDRMLADHMSGRDTIRGLLRYERETIAEYAAAVRREREAERRAAMTPAKYA